MAKPALVENIDYTIENGNYVFTSSYLEGRGYCCGNGCRNCPYGTASMRIVSMVPSWTETLLACGAKVVGRTRFCIHPAQGLVNVPAVGGTKDWKLQNVQSLQPDLILLDREENPKSMSEESPAEYFATHVQSISSVSVELARLALRFEAGGDGAVAEKLSRLADRWKKVDQAPQRIGSIRSLPGVLEWITEPSSDSIATAVYIIWKKPWMAAAEGTFISSVLAKLGVTDLHPQAAGKYPEFIFDSIPESVVLLFSSEPYPFAREIEQIKKLARPAALVDGEAFSWFGLRSLRFLENALSIGQVDLEI